MPPGFSAGLGFVLGLQQTPIGGPLGPLTAQMGHLSPPIASPGAPSGPAAFNPAQLKHMEMLMNTNSSRDYSKYLRSLAAKYNNGNPSTGDCFNSASSPFSPPTPVSRPPTLRSPDSPAGRLLSGEHLSPRGEGPRSSPQGLSQHPQSPHASQRSPASGFSLADFSSSQTLLNLVRSAQNSQLESYLKGAVKRPASSTQEGDPLDLSLTGPPVKRPRSPLSPICPSTSPSSPRTKEASMLGLSMSLASSRSRSRSPRCSSACANEEHQSLIVSRWTVDEVVSFVNAIDACAPYAEKFREQSIDGSILSALTEDHLTAYMGMRLGPALKLRQSLAKMMGHCSVCLHCLHCHGPSPAAQLSQSTTAKFPSDLTSTTRHPSSSPTHSTGSTSPRSSPLVVATSLDALAGQPTPASSSPSPPPSHPSPASTPTDLTNASN